jgi:putative endonuclease
MAGGRWYNVLARMGLPPAQGHPAAEPGRRPAPLEGVVRGEATSGETPHRRRRSPALVGVEGLRLLRRLILPRLRPGGTRESGEGRPLSRAEVGARGEKLAVGHLRKRGYRIVQTNFRSRHGEIDIIAREGECLVFVEVRTRKGHEYGTPEESITPAKVDRLTAAAGAYLQRLHEMPPSWRIDVVAIELAADGGVSHLRQIENAVEQKARDERSCGFGSA